MAIVLKMLLHGAEYNYMEYYHKNLLIEQKLFLNDFKNTLHKYEPINRETLFFMLDSFRKIKISNNPYAGEYALSISSNEFKDNNIFDMIDQSLRVIKQVRKKITHDHLIRPLKIFWIKTDYIFILNIMAVLSSFASIIILTFIKNYFYNYFNNIFENDNGS